MAYGKSLVLAKIQPTDRVAMPMPQSRRAIERRKRPVDLGKHTQIGPQRQAGGVFDPDTGEVRQQGYATYHATRTPPWIRKQRNRAESKQARRSRKRNR